jgi:hypothetical protein
MVRSQTTDNTFYKTAGARGGGGGSWQQSLIKKIKWAWSGNKTIRLSFKQILAGFKET